MNIEKLMIKDSSGKPSITMTAFCIGFAVVNLKLLVSGVEIMSYKMAAFSGSEYSLSIAALGSVYILRRNLNKGKDEIPKE